MNRLFLSILLYAMLHISGKELSAQQYYFRNMNTSENPASSLTFKSAEDTSGYIWMATNRGIMRYDGKNYKLFGKRDGITENEFYFVHAIPGTDSLYFISNDFKLFVYTKQTFSAISSIHRICWMTYNEQRQPFFLTRTGHVMTLINGQLKTCYMNNDTGLFFHIVSVPGGGFLISSNEGFKYLTSDMKNAQVILDDLKGRLVRIAPRIFKLSNGRIILSSITGLYEPSPDFTSARLLWKFGTDKEEVVCVTLNKNNQDLIVGSHQRLWRFENGITDDRHYRTIWPNRGVTDILATTEGAYVISTSTDGMFTTTFGSLNYGASEGLGTVRTNFAGIETQGKDLYVFTKDADILLKRDHRFVSFPTPKGISKPNRMLLHTETNDHLKVAFKFDTVRSFEIRNRKIAEQRFYSPKAVILETTLCDTPVFLLNLFNDLIIPDLGYHQHNVFNQSVVRLIKNSDNGEPVLLIDPKKNLNYYPTDNGYIVQNIHKPLSFTINNLGSDVTCMLKLSDDLLIAGTEEKGIAIVSSKDIFFLNTLNGLGGNRCIKMLKDKEVIWVLTENGITCFEVSQTGKPGKIRTFNTDNVLAGDINDFCISGDLIYTTGTQGVSSFSKYLSFKYHEPRVAIERMGINDIDTTVQGEYSFPYDYNNISISYKHVSLLNYSKVLYRYILVRDADTLVDQVTPDEKLQLYSLSHGHYTLQFFALGAAGNWSSSPTIVSLTIRPVFWKTWTFIILSGLVLAGITFFVLRYRMMISRKENLLKSKLIESELKALRLHMNPHFTFNILNSLQKFILKNDPLSANEYIAKFSRLMRSVMLYSDMQQLNLKEETEFLTVYVELEQFRFNPPFSFNLTIDEKLDLYSTYIPSLIMQPFVENAIKYGMTGKDGKLNILFSDLGAYVGVCIEDNGPGRDKTKEEQSRSPKEKVSTGIRYTEERLKLIVNNKSINPVIITDLFHHDKTPAGTRVDLIIPKLL